MKVLYLNSNKMGEGNSELGEKLLLTFIEKVYSSINIDAILCVNSGAHLATVNNKAVELFKLFEQKGTVISTCGTCLDFYNIREKLQVGNVGSMELLVNIMNKAEKVIRP